MPLGMRRGSRATGRGGWSARATTSSPDPTRRAHPDRVRVDEQRDHHYRVVRRPAVTVNAIGRDERGEIHLLDSVEHEPRKVLLGQQLAKARRQQQLLLTITRDEVLRHHRIVLNPPDDTRVCATPSARSGTPDEMARERTTPCSRPPRIRA